MSSFIKKYLILIINLCLLVCIFLYGYFLSKDKINENEVSITAVKESCKEYEETGIFIYKEEKTDKNDYVDELCDITNSLKTNKYNAFSTYLLIIDNETVSKLFFLIIPILIIASSIYSFNYYIDNTDKKAIVNDKYSIKMLLNSYKNIFLFIIFIAIALVISFIISGHIYYQDAIDIGFNFGLIDIVLYLVFKLSIFGVFTNVALIVGKKERSFIINIVISMLICGISIFLSVKYLGIKVPIPFVLTQVSTKSLILVLLTFFVTTHIVYDIYKDKNGLIKAKAIN